MSRIDVPIPSRLWYEEMNRIRHQIQQRWTQAQRTHRRQVALCRQQELARLLRRIPSVPATSQNPTSGQQADNPAGISKSTDVSRAAPDPCKPNCRRAGARKP